MNEVPIHPILVHIPIALSVLMPFILIGLIVSIRRGFLPDRVWWVGVLLQAVLVAGSLASLASGHSEEERVEDFVPHEALEAHENMAKAMSGAALVTLIIAAAGLRKSQQSVTYRLISLGASILVLGLASLTGHQGGELVYKHGAAGAAPMDMQKSAPSPEEEEESGHH